MRIPPYERIQNYNTITSRRRSRMRSQSSQSSIQSMVNRNNSICTKNMAWMMTITAWMLNTARHSGDSGIDAFLLSPRLLRPCAPYTDMSSRKYWDDGRHHHRTTITSSIERTSNHYRNGKQRLTSLTYAINNSNNRKPSRFLSHFHKSYALVFPTRLLSSSSNNEENDDKNKNKSQNSKQEAGFPPILPPPPRQRAGSSSRIRNAQVVRGKRNRARMKRRGNGPPGKPSSPDISKDEDKRIEASLLQPLPPLPSSDQNIDGRSSLLPPPLDSKDRTDTRANSSDGNVSSSWGDFFAGAASVDNLDKEKKKSKSKSNSNSNSNKRNQRSNNGGRPVERGNKPSSKNVEKEKNLPPPPPYYLPNDNDVFDSTLFGNTGLSGNISDGSDVSFPSSTKSPLPTLDGVLPVSELFYRSSQSISTDDDDDDEEEEDDYSDDDSLGANEEDSDGKEKIPLSRDKNQNEKDNGKKNNRREGRKNWNRGEEGDDEELPFSAEQSDRISTNNNEIRVRRNEAASVSASFDGNAGGKKDKKGSGGGQDGAQYKTDIAKLRATSKVSSSFEKQSSSTTQSPSKLKSQRRRRGDKRGNNNAGNKGRKMIRRGMEMLVGGEPINADPPLRFVELHYNFKEASVLASAASEMGIALKIVDNDDHYDDDEEDDSGSSENFGEKIIVGSDGTISPDSFSISKSKISMGLTSKVDVDWANIITMNSRDFGPLLHAPSVSKVSALSRGYYCEHFVSAAMKWKICPKDLTSIVKNHEFEKLVASHNSVFGDKAKLENSFESADVSITPESYDQLRSLTNASPFHLSDNRKDDNDKQEGFEESLVLDNTKEDGEVKQEGFITESSNKKGFSSAKGFGKEDKKKTKKNRSNSSKGAKSLDKNRDQQEHRLSMGGELKLCLEMTVAELESGKSDGQILRRVLSQGIATAIKAKEMGFDVFISKLLLNEIDSGITEFAVEFIMVTIDKMEISEAERATGKINTYLTKAMEGGDMALAMAAAAKDEKAWPEKLRNRIVEEFLFQADLRDEDAMIDDEDDFESSREQEGDITLSPSPVRRNNKEEFDGPFGMPGDTIYAKDDIYLGGGNGGVFADYSESSTNAPFSGQLGPLLVDAVVQRALQRQPRVIAIGDVHGCLDELQALLRRCDYQPGDLVVFLGDLVSKGPDSLSVVQMAREIGAMGVRGNHDFEVIRWHQAIKSGADPPVIGSEHFHIASSLDKKDLKWMYSLPWYISSKELGALFVHAGFVSGIRLAKQNPRLMMNMRSILPDGTVTSKFFNNWPWARLWDGPQTVLFGHDADRGLQQYEHAIGLDTGCVYGGRLTACILPEKRLVSVSAKREYFQYRRRRFD